MKKAFFFAIPLSVCNLRCHYCYLSQRPSSYEGVIPEMQFSPEQIAYAMRKERVGGGRTLILVPTARPSFCQISLVTSSFLRARDITWKSSRIWCSQRSSSLCLS